MGDPETDHMIQKRITSDIVERLRSEQRMALAPLHMSDAADEIERLRDLVDDLRRCLVDNQFEIEQLRIAYQQATNEIERVLTQLDLCRG